MDRVGRRLRCGSHRRGLSVDAAAAQRRRPARRSRRRTTTVVASRRSSCSASSGTLWLREASELLRFIVAIMGRLPIVTPVFVYAAVLSAAGLMVAPPLIAVVATERPLLRPWAITAPVLRGAGRHLRRRVRRARVHARPAAAPVRARAAGRRRADRHLGGRVGRARARPRAGRAGRLDADRRRQLAPSSMPWGRYALPVRVPRRRDLRSDPRRRRSASFAVKPLADGIQLSDVRSSRASQGCRSRFVLPPGVAPARSSLPGAVRARPLDGDVRGRAGRRRRLGRELLRSGRRRRSGTSRWRSARRASRAARAGRACRLAAAGHRRLVGRRHLGAAARRRGAGALRPVSSVTVSLRNRYGSLRNG